MSKPIITTVVAQGDLGLPSYNAGGSIVEAINAYCREVNALNAMLRKAMAHHKDIMPCTTLTRVKTWDECICDYSDINGKKVLFYNDVTTKSTHTVEV